MFSTKLTQRERQKKYLEQIKDVEFNKMISPNIQLISNIDMIGTATMNENVSRSNQDENEKRTDLSPP
jgi:hypothetical protein